MHSSPPGFPSQVMSPTHGAYSNSCPSSQWCHLTISSSVVPSSSHLQFFPCTKGKSEVVQLCPTLCHLMTVAYQAPLSMGYSRQEYWNGLPFPPPGDLPNPIFPSISVFSNESVLGLRWPNYWSFSFSISPSNECSGLISFRIDWLDILAVQALKSLLEHHSSKASTLWWSTLSPALTSIRNYWKNQSLD